jgi:hypothetical protein
MEPAYNMHVGKRKEETVVVGKPEGNRQAGTHRRKLENNIKMVLKQTACYGVDWVQTGSRE